MAVKPPSPKPSGAAGNGGEQTAKDVELLRVGIAREGKQVSAQWALHPQLKQDLQPDELKELTELMGKVTHLVGTRFSEILAETEPDKPGTA